MQVLKLNSFFQYTGPTVWHCVRGALIILCPNSVKSSQGIISYLHGSAWCIFFHDRFRHALLIDQHFSEHGHFFFNILCWIPALKNNEKLKNIIFNLLTLYIWILLENFCERLVPLTQILSSCSSVAYKTCVCTVHVKNYNNMKFYKEMCMSYYSARVT